MNLCELIRTSSLQVVKEAEHVTINDQALNSFADEMLQTFDTNGIDWNDGNLHYCEDASSNGPLTCQYIFVLDCLNFCFWPTSGMEYQDLSRGLRDALMQDHQALDASRLTQVNESTVSSWFGPTFTPPQLSERVYAVRELGRVLITHYQGLALNMVRQANHSTKTLLYLLTRDCLHFQDHMVYRGSQVYFYKRAQILISDIWGAYGRRTLAEAPGCHDDAQLGAFVDIEELTMFADYRVPQVLHSRQVLTYAPDLDNVVRNKGQIPSGSEMEIEIRAATIQAVERLREILHTRGQDFQVIEIDWMLWQYGEKRKDELVPHHRTLSIYY